MRASNIQLDLAKDILFATVESWTPLPHQIPPEGDEWHVWMLLGGRGSGKTMAGARYVLQHLEEFGKDARVGIGAPTHGDARSVCIEGVTGLYTLDPEAFEYNRSLAELRHKNGGFVKYQGAEDPSRWNGPQWTLLWADELALWKEESWHQAQFGLRLGKHPRAIVTTTPKNRKFVRDLSEETNVHVAFATTYDNPNLPDVAIERLQSRYGGTRLGRQELMAEWIDDVEGALWHMSLFQHEKPTDDMARIVVAIDPAVTATEQSDETGIIVAARSSDNIFHILEDLSGRYSPDQWARVAINAYHDFNADKIIAETNNGGEMVQLTLRTVDRHVPYKSVHASRGKRIRAEPIAALYEQGKVYHAKQFELLEEQLCTWTPESKESPDRMDALVWGLSELSSAGSANIRFL